VRPLEGAVVAKIRKRIDAFRAYQIHIRTLAAVAAVRPAEGHEFLATKADRATPAMAGLDLDGSFVDESHGTSSLSDLR
jgi:hypothetical protein